MSLAEFHFHSPTLQMKVSANVLVPDVGTPPFPVYYLLHGLSDDHSIWLRFTRIEPYVRNLPLIVVMPQGFRGFYTNNHNGAAYADYIATDLPQIIERTFPAKSDRASRCIGGLSMGGYGALRIAWAHPDKYISANSHSGALAHGERPSPRPDGPISQKEFHDIFGPNPRGTDHDLIRLATELLKRRQQSIPKTLIDCGADDFLIDDNRSFHSHLQKMNFPHEYKEFPGEHNWDYWNDHIKDAVQFHCAALNIAPIIPPPK